VIVIEAVSPAEMVLVVAEAVNVSEDGTIVEFEGPADRNPNPNEVTTTSARRLKVNFVI
jgi:hypothetical protein